MRTFITVAVILAIEALAAAVYLYFTHPAGKPVPVGGLTPVPEGPGWVDLLDETHSTLWRNATDDKDIFEITDGMLHIYGVTLTPLRYVAYPDTEVGDFDLHLEYKLVRGANSGVFIRKQPNDEVMRGFEIQVLDDFGKPPTRNTSGGIYDVTTPMYNMSRPAGEWNSFDIYLRGKMVAVYHNGWMVVYTDLGMMKEPLGKFSYAFSDLPTKGMLALQDHGGEVWYRNIRIRPWAQGKAPAPRQPSDASAPAPAAEEAAPAEVEPGAAQEEKPAETNTESTPDAP
jgi:hypothetical protein